MELKAIIVQIFQDGTHSDDILRHVKTWLRRESEANKLLFHSRSL